MTFGTVFARGSFLECAPNPHPPRVTYIMKRQLLALAALSAAVFGVNAQQSDGNIMGVAKAGDTVVIHADATGVHREMTVEADGKYQFRRMPLGTYVVTVKHADGQAEKPKQVTVRPGATARIQ